MKKIILALILVLAMLFSLTGCGLQDMAANLLNKLQGQNSQTQRINNDDDDEDEDDDDSKDKIDSSDSDSIDSENEYNFGYESDGTAYYLSINELATTDFFDFKVTKCETVDVYNGECAGYDGYTASEGNKLVAVTFEITDTSDDVYVDYVEDYGLMMFDNDFYGIWDVNNFENGAYSLGAMEMDWTDNEWLMTKNETLTKTLVWEVPEEKTMFFFWYVEYYANQTYGDDFFVACPID